MYLGWDYIPEGSRLGRFRSYLEGQLFYFAHSGETKWLNTMQGTSSQKTELNLNQLNQEGHVKNRIFGCRD